MSDYSVESISSESSVEQQDDVLKQLYKEGGLQTEKILKILNIRKYYKN